MAYSIVTRNPLFVSPLSTSIGIEIEVVDEFGEPASGVVIEWAASHGTLDDTTTTSDSTGLSSNTLDFTGVDENRISLTFSIDGDTVLDLNILKYNANLGPVLITNTEDIPGGSLLEGNNIEGVQAMVLPYANASLGDLITFHWGPAQRQVIYTGTNLPFILDIGVFFGVSVLSDGEIPVYYDIRDTAGNTAYSQPVLLTISNSPFTQATLPAPELPDNPYGIINYESSLTGTLVQIPADQNINPGNSYTLYLRASQGEIMFFEGVVAEGIIDDSDAPTDIILGREVFEDWNNVHGVFYYTVTGPLGTNLSRIKNVIIDTVPPGKALLS